MIIALAGNQNCGKTTLFNRLTGAHQHVGNWPGVTVEKRNGALLATWQPGHVRAVQVVDLPGVYSLAPFSQEEEITRRFLLESAPDVIVNVVDACHLERNLYLTLQLVELGRPVVIALNLMDEVKRRGGSVRIPVLAKELGVPVVPVCARSGQGIPALIRQVMEAARTEIKPPSAAFCTGASETSLRDLTRLIQTQPELQRNLKQAGIPAAPHAAATALLEGGIAGLQRLRLRSGDPVDQQLTSVLQSLETRTGLSPSAALAADRYRYLEQLTERCCAQGTASHLTTRLDELLLCSGWSIPILAAVLLMVFFAAFGWPGQLLTDAFTGLLQAGIQRFSQLLIKVKVLPGLQSLLTEGLLPGLCSVLSFLPPLMLLMFLMNLLEESGYLARAASLLDRPLRMAGMSGRSLIPFLLGFGCTVPAVLCARGMRNRRERCRTVLLTPLMSCGAKLPVYALLAGVFFPEHSAIAVACLYLMGILLALAAAFLAKRMSPPGEEPFLLELPEYRRPSLRNAIRELWQKSCEFVKRTFSVILLATLAVWILSSYTFALGPAADLEQSMLGVVAGWLSPLFRPCGFGNPTAVAALLTGLLAKENIVSTMTVLMGAQAGSLTDGLQTAFASGLSAFSYLVFVLLYPPCAAATAAMSREVNGPRSAFSILAGYSLLAWGVSTMIYQAGCLLGLG